MSRDDFVGYAVPAITLGMGLFAWEALVRYFAVPSYLLPAPSLIIATLITDWPTLSACPSAPMPRFSVGYAGFIWSFGNSISVYCWPT